MCQLHKEFYAYEKDNARSAAVIKRHKFSQSLYMNENAEGEVTVDPDFLPFIKGVSTDLKSAEVFCFQQIANDPSKVFYIAEREVCECCYGQITENLSRCAPGGHNVRPEDSIGVGDHLFTVARLDDFIVTDEELENLIA